MEKLSWMCRLTPDCENPRLGNLEGCASCESALRRLAKDLNKVPKKPKLLKKVSDGKKLVNGEYSKLRKEYLQIWSRCETGAMLYASVGFAGCTKHSTQIHHCSVSATNFLNSDTWLSVCPECHEFIETKLSAWERRELDLLYD